MVDLSSVDLAYAVDHLVIRRELGITKQAGIATSLMQHAGPAIGTALSKARGVLSDAGSAISQHGGELWKNLSDPKTPGWTAGRNAAIGAGVGGIAGVGRSLLSDERDKDPLGDMLTGATLGGALGGGGTLFMQGARKLVPEAFGEASVVDRAEALRKANQGVQAEYAGTPEHTKAVAALEKAKADVQAVDHDPATILKDAPNLNHTEARGKEWRPDMFTSLAWDNPFATAGTITGAGAGGFAAGKLDQTLRAPFVGKAMQDHVRTSGLGKGETPDELRAAVSGKPRYSFNANKAIGDVKTVPPHTAGTPAPKPAYTINPNLAKSVRRQVTGRTPGVRYGGGIVGAVIGNLLGRAADNYMWR